MPLYEYHCASCEREIELLVRSDERPVCSHCGSAELTKLFSVVAAHTLGKSSGPDPGAWTGCGKPQCGQGGCGMGMPG